MKIDLVNTRLLSHPMNWAIVWGTLVFVAFAYALLSERIKSAMADQSIIPD